MIKVRPATTDDSVIISNIWNFYISNTTVTVNSAEKSNATVKNLIDSCKFDGRAFLLAEDESDVIGFCTYFQFRNGTGYVKTMEHTIFIATRAKRVGVGRALMEALCNHAKDAGVKSLWGCVTSENLEAKAFHESVGFSYIARLPQVGLKFNRWIDLLLMQKILAN